MNGVADGRHELKIGSSILARRSGTDANVSESPRKAILQDWHVGILAPHFLDFFLEFVKKIQKKWAPAIPTCQSRRIAVRSLSGAFASVPPRRVSMDDLIFNSYSPTATLIMNSTTSKVGLEAHIQHWTF